MRLNYSSHFKYLLLMKTKFIIILLLSYGAAMAQKNQKAQLFYASDQYDLTDEHKQKLKTLCDSLKNYIIVQISIKGYTDSDADSVYNIGLSNKRTNQVKTELLNLGLNNRIIFENYFGEKYAYFDSISEDKKSKNRRVDIIVSVLPKEKKVIVKDSCIDGDTSLVMENGTIFKMKKCNLREIGNKIQFVETFSTEQMVAQGMNTNTENDGQLITGGMISIGNNSTNCSFKDTITVLIPIKDTCINPRLFSLWERNGKNWKPTKSVKVKQVTIKNNLYYELKITRCVKLNLDYRVPKGSEITIINPVKNYKMIRLEVYGECPRFYWQFTKISNNKKKFSIVYLKSEPMIKVWLLNSNDKMDTLISNFIPLSSLNHKIFDGFGGKKPDEYNKFFIFKIKEKKFYHKYWLRKENFE